MQKVAVFGCKSTTVFLLESVMSQIDIECVITITPEAGKKNVVADYLDVTSFCKSKNIEVYAADRYDLKSDADRQFFEEKGFDIAFVIGWQRLIPQFILSTMSIGAFGMHGSTDDLPIGRGRSPMNWGLIEQRKHFFTNIFRYDPGIDSGDILDTFVFSIQPTDTSETMHFKNVLAMKTLILRNINHLMTGDLNLKQQSKKLPTYYPKRCPADSLIDWRNDIFQIEAFIRAVTRPFNGAYSYIESEKIVLWRASIFETDLVDFGYGDMSFGEIVEVFPGEKFLVKCRGGILIVHEYRSEIPVKKGLLLVSPCEEIKRFPVNESGFHDVEGG